MPHKEKVRDRGLPALDNLKPGRYLGDLAAVIRALLFSRYGVAMAQVPFTQSVEDSWYA